MAKTAVNASRHKVTGVNRIPHGVKFNIKPTTDTSARLITKLSVKRSNVSMYPEEVLIGILAGNSAFINVKPGKNRTKMMPSEERTKTSVTLLSGMVKMATIVTAISTMVVQYQLALEEKKYCLTVAIVGDSFLMK